MNAYTVFANVYDSFMRDIPYNEWCDLLIRCLMENGITEGRLLDLGCGTGKITALMAEKGFEMTGVDSSYGMLKEAKKKQNKSSYKIMYEQQDLRALYIENKFPAAVCVCDTINYMENEFDLESAFTCIHDALSKKGILIIDMKTREYYKSLGTQTFTDTVEKGTYIWENDFDTEENNNYYNLTFFIKSFGNKYKKYNEEHIQHSFTENEIIQTAEKAGFKTLNTFIKEERQYFILERE